MTRKLENDQNVTHFCRFVVMMFAFVILLSEIVVKAIIVSKLLLFCIVAPALKWDGGIRDYPVFNLNWHFYAFLKLQLAVLSLSKMSHLTTLCPQGARKPPEGGLEFQ